jgi:hypothetical protein
MSTGSIIYISGLKSGFHLHKNNNVRINTFALFIFIDKIVNVLLINRIVFHMLDRIFHETSNLIHIILLLSLVPPNILALV